MSPNHLDVVACHNFHFYPSAVERSWSADFIGKLPLEALEKHVKGQMVRGKLYARYCSIVQSSGMGKSRLMDELSKKHFLIPINLRPKGSEGVSYPLSPPWPVKLVC